MSAEDAVLSTRLWHIITCPLCAKVLTSPVANQMCGHIFCDRCINHAIERGCFPVVNHHELMNEPVDADDDNDDAVAVTSRRGGADVKEVMPAGRSEGSGRVRSTGGSGRRGTRRRKITFQCPVCLAPAFKWTLVRVACVESFIRTFTDTLGPHGVAELQAVASSRGGCAPPPSPPQQETSVSGNHVLSSEHVGSSPAPQRRRQRAGSSPPLLPDSLTDSAPLFEPVASSATCLRRPSRTSSARGCGGEEEGIQRQAIGAAESVRGNGVQECEQQILQEGVDGASLCLQSAAATAHELRARRPSVPVVASGHAAADPYTVISPLREEGLSVLTAAGATAITGEPTSARRGLIIESPVQLMRGGGAADGDGVKRLLLEEAFAGPSENAARALATVKKAVRVLGGVICNPILQAARGTSSPSGPASTLDTLALGGHVAGDTIPTHCVILATHRDAAVAPDGCIAVCEALVRNQLRVAGGSCPVWVVSLAWVEESLQRGRWEQPARFEVTSTPAARNILRLTRLRADHLPNLVELLAGCSVVWLVHERLSDNDDDRSRRAEVQAARRLALAAGASAVVAITLPRMGDQEGASHGGNANNSQSSNPGDGGVAAVGEAVAAAAAAAAGQHRATAIGADGEDALGTVGGMHAVVAVRSSVRGEAERLRGFLASRKSTSGAVLLQLNDVVEAVLSGHPVLAHGSSLLACNSEKTVHVRRSLLYQ